jgi:tetratricopeptide (TPR) repeat protein
MRTKSILILGLLGVVCLPALGKAGVYNPDLRDLAKNPPGKTPEVVEQLKKALDDELMEPAVAGKTVTPLPFEPLFRLALDTQTITNKDRRQRYLQRADELRKKVEADPDNVTDRVSLSAYLLRLGQPEDVSQAIQLLEGLARGAGRNNFMVAANLATAYLLTRDLQRADDYLQQALSIWPREWPGLSKEQLAWYKEVETAQLKLIRVRRRELLAHGGKDQPIENVDDLFGVKFGDSAVVPALGGSTVGLLAAPLAPAPVLAASAVVPGRTDGANYEAGTIAAAAKEKLPKNALAIVQQLLLWMPNDGRLYWLLGELLNAQGDINNAKTVLDQCADTRKINAKQLIAHRQVLDEAITARNQKPENPDWLPERNKLILVGSGVGVVVLFLAYLQVREVRRRKHNDEPGA